MATAVAFIALLYHQEVQAEAQIVAVMEVLHLRCAGMFAYKKSVAVCAKVYGHTENVTFESSPAGLRMMGNWLRGLEIHTLAIGSAGLYWKPVWNLLEAEFGNVALVLASPDYVKPVPGRKFNVGDAEWLAELHSFGLVRGSRVPVREDRELQELLEVRRKLSDEQFRMLCRLEKLLEEAGVELAKGADAAGIAAVRAILSGEKDPAKLIKATTASLKSKPEAIYSALDGSLGRHQCLLLEVDLHVLEGLSRAILRINQEVDEQNRPEISDEVEELVVAGPSAPPESPPRVQSKEKSSRSRKGLPCAYDTTAVVEGRTEPVRLVDISLGGGKLLGSTQMHRGHLIQISNPLPDENLHEPVTARIVWVRPSKEVGRSDIGLRFEESPETLGRSWVIKVLNEIRMQSQSFRQRHYTQAVANLPGEVVFAKSKERTAGTVLHIGLGGAVLALDRPISAGTRLTLSIGPIGNHEKLELRCEVVSSVHDEGRKEWTHTAQFSEISTTQTRLLGRYLVDLVKGTLHAP